MTPMPESVYHHARTYGVSRQLYRASTDEAKAAYDQLIEDSLNNLQRAWEVFTLKPSTAFLCHASLRHKHCPGWYGCCAADHDCRTPGQDHAEMWNAVQPLTGAPARLLTHHPYHLQDRDVYAAFDAEHGTRHEFHPPSKSWYYPASTHLILVWGPPR